MKITTPLIVTIAATLVAVLGFATYLIGTGHDVTSYVGTVTTLVALIPGLIGINVAQKKQAEKLANVEKNTNGTLSARDAKIASLEAENKALRSVATPEQIQQVAPVVPASPTAPAAPISDPIGDTVTPSDPTPAQPLLASEGATQDANG